MTVTKTIRLLSIVIAPIVLSVLPRGAYSSTFSPKQHKQTQNGVSGFVKVPLEGRGYPLVYTSIEDHPEQRRKGIDLDLSSSSDNNNSNNQNHSQRTNNNSNNKSRSHSHPQTQRQIPMQGRGPPLRSMIAVDMEVDVEYDPKVNSGSNSGTISRVVDTVRTSVSDKVALLKMPSSSTKVYQRRRRLVQQRQRNINIHASSATATSTRFFPAPTTTAAPTATAVAATKTKTRSTTVKDRINSLDVAVFVTYFCNIAVVTLSVVTVPAIALEHNLTPHATATFCAGMASMAPLGGFVGKLLNGFVCQRMGGRRSSWVYLVVLAALSLGMSYTHSLASVGLFLVGFDFLASIQWTSNSSVLDQHYGHKPLLKARGLTLLSISSTVGALAAKTFGAGLLQATQWRTVCRAGAGMALVGAAAIYFGGAQKKLLLESRNHSARSSQSQIHTNGDRNGDASSFGTATTSAAAKVSAGGQQNLSAVASLKLVLSNPIFWMIGIGHSLGHLARISDRLLGPFLQEVGGISSSMAIGLTSSVTIGFVLGLLRGSVFSKMKSVTGKMNMIQNSYIAAGLSTAGLAACGIKGVSNFVGGSSTAIVAAITLFSGIIASAVSFQFYQIPNLVSTTMFPDSSSVALSLTDAIGFLVTAGVMGLNSLVLGAFGWSASWAFMAAIFSLGGISMTRALRPVLVEAARNQR